VLLRDGGVARRAPIRTPGSACRTCGCGMHSCCQPLLCTLLSVLWPLVHGLMAGTCTAS
jgi:hypothetical protein